MTALRLAADLNHHDVGRTLTYIRNDKETQGTIQGVDHTPTTVRVWVQGTPGPHNLYPTQRVTTTGKNGPT